MANSVEQPLLEKNEGEKQQQSYLWAAAFMAESKKLWAVAGPAVLTRLSSYGQNLVTQAFVGHLGELELAAITVSNSVIMGFVSGFLLGMASAVETVCGQAFGARKYHLLGVYLQRSWILLLLVATIMLPVVIWSTPLLILVGESPQVAAMSGELVRWMIPIIYGRALSNPFQRFLQSQIKNSVIAYLFAAALLIHILLTWLFVQKIGWGIHGAAVALDISVWLPVLGMLIYVTCGGCPLTWSGFSTDAFTELWSFLKLSLSSGVMICLDYWYYQIVILLTGMLKNAAVAVDAVSVCMNVQGALFMIPLAFLAAIGVRVSNELGAGNGRGAKFAVIVTLITSVAIGIVFWILVVLFRKDFALIFTESPRVIKAVSKLAYILAFTILMNSVQPVLSGVALGSGWQSRVAYINIICYYVFGLPLAIVFGWVLKWGVMGIWGGLIAGVAAQTLVLIFITYRCDWETEALKATQSVDSWNRTTRRKVYEDSIRQQEQASSVH